MDWKIKVKKFKINFLSYFIAIINLKCPNWNSNIKQIYSMKLQNSICNCYSASLVQPKPHHNNVLDKLCLSNNEQIFQIIINARDKWNLSSTIFFSLNWMGWNCTLLHVKTCKQVMFFYYVHAVKIAWGEKRPDFFFRADFLSWPFFLFFLSSLWLHESHYI